MAPSRAPEALGKAVATLAQSLEALGERAQWPRALTDQVNLVLEELLTNALTHGRESADSPTPEVVLHIECSVSGAVHLELRDDARAFDPVADTPRVEAPMPGNDLQVGGLGLHLVREMSEDLRYRRDGAHNRVYLTVRALSLDEA